MRRFELHYFKSVTGVHCFTKKKILDEKPRVVSPWVSETLSSEEIEMKQLILGLGAYTEVKRQNRGSKCKVTYRKKSFKKKW